jgi:hypothetical protein
MTIQMNDLLPDPKAKKARVRSPNYPAINLEEAIKKATEFYNYEKRNSANVEIAMKHWGFKPTSSGGMVTLAALNSFGLLSDSGAGKQRKVQLTELALKIILDERSQSVEREAAIKQAALMPKIHASLWNKYHTSLPSDENLRHELVMERKFNPNAASGFIGEYKDTIQFAKLVDSDIMSIADEDKEEEQDMVSAPANTSPTPNTSKPPIAAGSPQNQPSAKEISLPVGVTEDGQVIFAHVRFDAPLKRGMLASLKQLLDALEKNIA